ncbi:hypothetical protein BJV82DRAFT_595520 [Fennellomyces sp. T-0311]|nr:hypothetical protein BJV82DRAFT_595520 [Fennellomyces sp. T-0311]
MLHTITTVDNAVDSHSCSLDSSSASLLDQQLGFMGALYSDILLMVFSYLDQQDCLTCMEVCQAWQQIVPLYSQSVWETVSFSSRGLSMDTVYLEQCLGDHVKTVVFDGNEGKDKLYHIMRKLVDWGCNKIEALEFRGYVTVDQDTFLALLERLAPSLTRLYLTHHGSNITLPDLFNACPNLSHFTYQSYGSVSMANTTLLVPVAQSLQFPKITYLSLDAFEDSQLHLEPILQLCPNLQYFVGPKCVTHGGVIRRHITLDQLLSWCPKIICLQTNHGYSPLYEITGNSWEPIASDTYKTDAYGLRHYEICCENSDRGELTRQLMQHQDTLEFVSLYKHRIDHMDWSPMLRSLQLNRLRTLICDGVHFNAASIVAMLNHCPLLETLVLEGVSVTFSATDVQFLPTLPLLSTLKCVKVEFEDESCLSAMLERFPALKYLVFKSSSLTINLSTAFQCLRRLKHLYLDRVQWKYDNHDDDPVRRLFRYSSPHELGIEVIQLRRMSNISYGLLEAMAHIPTLKVLNADLDAALCVDDKFGLDRFVDRLKETRIEDLTLHGVPYMSHAALDGLGDLPMLRDLRVARTYDETDVDNEAYTHIEFSGLLQMLRKTTSVKLIYLDKTMMVATDEKVYTHDEIATLMEDEIPTRTFLTSIYRYPFHLANGSFTYNVIIHYIASM